MFLLMMVLFETLFYTLAVSRWAAQDTLYTKALVPKFIAIAALIVSLLRYSLDSYWLSNAAAFVVYIAVFRKPLRIGINRSIPIVFVGQLIYNFVLWYWIE
ncbi:hypothetical protein N9D31_02615 [Oligoflexaceae bacterium]|nr:hypothetical protein [Oligoflexaceae bacterium]